MGVRAFGCRIHNLGFRGSGFWGFRGEWEGSRGDFSRPSGFMRL